MKVRKGSLSLGQGSGDRVSDPVKDRLLNHVRDFQYYLQKQNPIIIGAKSLKPKSEKEPRRDSNSAPAKRKF